MAILTTMGPGPFIFVKIFQVLSEFTRSYQKVSNVIYRNVKKILKAIQSILQAQKETSDQLMKANERLADIHAKNLLAHSKAQKETDELNADLAQCRRELNKAKSVNF